MLRLVSLAVAVVLTCASSVVAQSVRVTGPDGGSTTLTGEVWANLPRETVELTVHDQIHRYSGPTLASVLGTVDAPLGLALRGPALKSYVLVRAADDYQVVFSLAELDPAMRASTVILADRDDGQPLTENDGPLRLVVQGDARPARSVRQVTSIELRRAD